MEKTPADFAEKISHCSERDRALIEKAFLLLEESSLDAGTDFPVDTGAALLLSALKLDAPSVIAALLMKLPREKIPPEKIEELFGGEIVSLLAGIERISRLSGKTNTLHEAVIIRNMLFLLADDYRVVLITLTGKFDSLRRVSGKLPPDAAPDEKDRSFARECLNVYAPLAVRLGISWMKDEMEDLSLKILNREVYGQIKEMISAKRAERTALLSVAEEAVRQAAGKAGITIEVTSRAKHFYSIYMKMRRRNKSAAEIFDLFGIRILCATVEQCYTLLGIVHRLWKPVDGNFKDYIAKPKPNGYRSLHTAVIISGDESLYAGERGAEERFLEIQIRTREMHHVAENGVASHWLYKRGAAGEIIRPRENNAGEKESAASWFDDMRREITKKAVYVFTPQGKVIELPVGSTPIDFAYRIHTAVAEHCAGAKADGSIIPLYSELRNTQTVEILTGAQAHPTVNWLEAAKSPKARAKIRAWLEKHADFAGSDKIEKPAEKNAAAKKKAAVPLSVPLRETEPPPVLQVVQNSHSESFSVRIANEKNMMVRFARCCHPVAGDPITGFVSRGRGIIIHRENCRNLANIPDFAERQIRAEWEGSVSACVRRFRIEARFQANLFSEIEAAACKYRGHLLEGRLEKTGGAKLSGVFTIRVEEESGLKSALKKIRNIPGIISLQSLS